MLGSEATILKCLQNERACAVLVSLVHGHYLGQMVLQERTMFPTGPSPAQLRWCLGTARSPWRLALPPSGAVTPLGAGGQAAASLLQKGIRSFR